MKIFKLLLLQFILAFLFDLDAKAHTIKQGGNAIDTTSIIFTGKISDLKDASNLSGESTLHIYVSNLPLSFIEMTAAPHREFVIKYTEGEIFKIKVPKVGKINYVYISYPTPLNKPIPPSVDWLDNIYIAIAGDSINCQLGANTRRFSGKGAEKFNLQQRLYELRYIGPLGLYQKIRDKNTIIQGLNELDFKCDSVYQIQKQVIEGYKDSVDQSTVNVMTASCIGTRYYGLLRTLTTLKDQYPIIVGSDFYKKIGTQADGIATTDLLQSPVYYNIILQKLRLESDLNILELCKTAQLKRLFHERYKLITERYTGSVKDKLVALLVLGSPGEGPRVLPQLIDNIHDKYYKEPLTVIMNLKKKGRDFSNYEVTDKEGRTVSFSEFNKKVVLLDFWYTGCIGCAKLNQSLAPIYEIYKDNPAVQFVSVSTDRTFDIWQKGVRSGIYTHENSMNLYTGDLSTRHPIITENMIVSYPQFYILKNGMIWNATPPKPRGPMDLTTIKELRVLIDTALNE